MNKSLKTSLKMIEGLGKLFYGVYGYGPRTRLIKAKRDWEDALEVFLRHYAFERLSGFPRYSNAGIQAIKSVAGSSKKPPPDITRKVWKEFLKALKLPANGKGANRKVNPFWPKKDRNQQPLLHFIAGLREYDYSLIYWAEQMLRQGEASAAYDGLQGIRGIAQKIGTLFLRDIAYVFGIRESEVDDARYFQPVDIWVRKASSVLIPESQGKNDWKTAQSLSSLAQNAGINGCLLNAGLWLLGTEIVESGEYEASLKTPNNLAKHLDQYVKQSTYWGNEVNKVIRLIDSNELEVK